MKCYGEITITFVDTGLPISSVDVWYYQSTSPTTLSDGNWATSVPRPDVTKFIWSKTIVELDDARKTSFETDAICIGTDITGITEQYYLSTSKETQTGGEWLEQSKTWTVGAFMWTRSKVTYVNPIRTEYTEPVLAIDNIKEELKQTKTEMSNAIFKLDAVEKSITEEVWKNTIIKVENDKGEIVSTTLENLLIQHNVSLNGISTKVSEVETEVGKKADGTEFHEFKEATSESLQKADEFRQTVEQSYAKKEDLDNISVDIGTRNLIRNSQTMIFYKYGFVNSVPVFLTDHNGNTLVDENGNKLYIPSS